MTDKDGHETGEHGATGGHGENKLVAERRRKLHELRAAGNAYPNDFRRDAIAASLQAAYGAHSAEIGNNNFFASHNVIEHHSKVGDHNAFGPGCTACGRVTIGNSIRFGMHVGIEPYLTIGDRCIIASGTTLTSSVPENTIVKARSTNEFRKRS